MMRTTTSALLLLVLVGFGVNALLGGPSSEDALRRYDQHLIDAWAGKLAGSRSLMPRVAGFVVDQRVPLFLLSYYRGQSTVADREISCASRDSVVLWYGVDAVVVWQEGLWFPDRSAVHRRYAVSGLLH